MPHPAIRAATHRALETRERLLAGCPPAGGMGGAQGPEQMDVIIYYPED